MREAAEEEKRIAIERGSYHEGVPLLQLFRMQVGASAHINIVITPSQE